MVITVVIPVYNVEPYISDCIQSVMRQTYKGPMECILVDDCGTDKSIEVAEKLIDEYEGPIEFKILHHEHNRGLSAARNTGMDAAIGEYLYFLDSDDWISNDCIASLMQPMQDYLYDIVIGDYIMFGDRDGGSSFRECRNELLGNSVIFESYSERKLSVIAWNKLYRLSFLRNNNICFKEGQLHEDELWTYFTMLSTEAIAIVHKITYYYRVRALSIVTDSTNTEAKIRSYYETLQEMHRHPHPYTEAYHKCLLFYWNYFMDIAFSNHIGFWKYYKILRTTCPYKPLSLFREGELTIWGVKRKLHFVLPPWLAYHYLRLRYYYRCIVNKI